MRVMRRTCLAAAFAALSVTATACGSDAGGDSGDGGKAEIGLSISNLNNPFFVEMKKGAEAEAKKQKATISVTDAQNDAAIQSNQVQNFTSQNKDVIVINPVDSRAAGPPVKAAANAEIPVVAVDRAVEDAEVATTVASNNVQGGELAAQALAEKIREKGKVVVLRGLTGTSTSNERFEGFEKEIKNYPGVKVVAKQPAGFDRAKGMDVMTNLLQANPDISGVFAENDEMALGAVEALRGKAGDSVQVIGFDGTPDALRAVDQGKIASIIAQQPAELGRMAVRNAVRAADDTKTEKSIKIPVTVVSKDNVAEFLP